MNRSELVENVSQRIAYLRKKDVKFVIEEALKIIEDALKNGERITLTDFGSWSTKLMPSKKVRNPKTSESFTIGPRIKVKWTTSGKLNAILNAPKEK